TAQHQSSGGQKRARYPARRAHARTAGNPDALSHHKDDKPVPPLNLTCVRTLRLMALAVVCGLMLLPVAERTAAQNDALQAEDISIETRQDIYGFEHLVATGHLRNDGDEAYRNITLQASALDAGGEVVGGGIGYLVNA